MFPERADCLLLRDLYFLRLMCPLQFLFSVQYPLSAQQKRTLDL